MNSKWRKSVEGFTLLEVMVALAIISFAVVTYVHSQNTSLALLNESTTMTVATLLAQGRMVVLESSDNLAPLEREGTFDAPEYAAFRWKERVTSTPLPNVLEVRVDVSWEEPRGRRGVELVSWDVRK